jgi:hypothetical protein
MSHGARGGAVMAFMRHLLGTPHLRRVRSMRRSEDRVQEPLFLAWTAGRGRVGTLAARIRLHVAVGCDNLALTATQDCRVPNSRWSKS